MTTFLDGGYHFKGRVFLSLSSSFRFPICIDWYHFYVKSKYIKYYFTDKITVSLTKRFIYLEINSVHSDNSDNFDNFADCVFIILFELPTTKISMICSIRLVLNCGVISCPLSVTVIKFVSVAKAILNQLWHCFGIESLKKQKNLNVNFAFLLSLNIYNFYRIKASL